MAEKYTPIDTLAGSSPTPESPDQHDRGFLVDGQPYQALPPADMWTIDSMEDARASIETPLDYRGLIDVDSLIVACKQLIKPEHRYTRERSRHHLYWTAEMYERYQESRPESQAVAFREQVVNIGLMPKQFENLIHFVTRPAPVPPEYSMRLQLESWRLAVDLFVNARDAVRWERRARHREQLLAEKPGILKPEFAGRDIIGEEFLAGAFEKNFRGIGRHLEAMESIPEEFRMIEPTDTPADIAKHLGKIMANHSVPLISRVTAA